MSDLQSLWQSAAPRIDTERLIARLQQQNRALRRVNLISFGICAVCLVIVLLLELVGQLPTRGVLSVIGTLSFAYSVFKYRRDKANLIAAYSEEPSKLLPFLIKRTRAARNLGLYFLFMPFPAILFGFGLGYFLDEGTSSAGHDLLLVSLLIPALLFIFGLMIYGYRLAARKSKELEELMALQAELKA